MITFSHDYTGRQVDVLAFDGASPSGEVLLQQVMAQPYQGGKVTAGIQKLAQRFLLCLLTEKGSCPWDVTWGTYFMTEAHLGRFQTPLDVYGAFSQALTEIQTQLTAVESETDPVDERFASAVIDSVAVEADVSKVYVTLWSRAGRDRAVLVSIPLTV